MVIFCSDLDNTLIYSYKQEIGKDKILVETMEGRELSFMTRRAYGMLKAIAEEMLLVPVTTRSLAQYKRISFGAEVPVKYALVANGGILLEDGEISQGWLQKTRDMAGPAMGELEKGRRLLEEDPQVCFQVRLVDELFVFTKSRDPMKTGAMLKEKLDPEKVMVDCNGTKVYIFPKILNKGEALRRLRSYLKPCRIIAAGDSRFDISMLEAADRGLFPDTLEGIRKGAGALTAFPRDCFGEAMLEYALKWNIDGNFSG